MSFALQRARATHLAVKQHFLKSHPPEQWAVVTNNPQLFNRAWRRLLGWPPGDTPPIIRK